MDDPFFAYIHGSEEREPDIKELRTSDSIDPNPLFDLPDEQIPNQYKLECDKLSYFDDFSSLNFQEAVADQSENSVDDPAMNFIRQNSTDNGEKRSELANFLSYNLRSNAMDKVQISSDSLQERIKGEEKFSNRFLPYIQNGSTKSVDNVAELDSSESVFGSSDKQRDVFHDEITRRRMSKKCANCNSTDSRAWRRSPYNSTQVLCNACGLYVKTHGVHREIIVVNGEKKTRRRNKTTKVKDCCKQSSQHSIIGRNGMTYQFKPSIQPNCLHSNWYHCSPL